MKLGRAYLALRYADARRRAGGAGARARPGEPRSAPAHGGRAEPRVPAGPAAAAAPAIRVVSATTADATPVRVYRLSQPRDSRARSRARRRSPGATRPRRGRTSEPTAPAPTWPDRRAALPRRARARLPPRVRARGDGAQRGDRDGAAARGRVRGSGERAVRPRPLPRRGRRLQGRARASTPSLGDAALRPRGVLPAPRRSARGASCTSATRRAARPTCARTSGRSPRSARTSSATADAPSGALAPRWCTRAACRRPGPARSAGPAGPAAAPGVDFAHGSGAHLQARACPCASRSPPRPCSGRPSSWCCSAHPDGAPRHRERGRPSSPSSASSRSSTGGRRSR